MRVFGDDKYSGRRRDKYGSRDRRDRSDRPQMYDAVCDRCGKECKVPFKPSNDKPIYCSECFEEVGNGDSDRRSSRGRRDNYRSDRRRSDRKEMFTAICDDCGKECEVPFKPSSDKPIYCSECFEKRGGNDKGNGNNKQLEEINEKLDRILEILGEKMEDIEEKDDDNDEKEIEDTEEEKTEEIKEE
jgi:CxxC-x17-CxxC domain-containing protein